MHVLSVASGKGGVGKSLFASNIAIALAQAGRRVILADLDLGASNLHLILGIGAVKEGIGTYLSGNDLVFEDIIIDTDYKNLKFIPGDAEIPGMANLKTGQKTKLIRKLYTLDADFLILDLGAGTSFNTIDFFLSSSMGIVVTAPTLTSTLNAYLFLKNTVFRLMSTIFSKKSKAGEILVNLKKEGTSLQKIYIPKLLERIKQEDPDSYYQYMDRMKNFHPMIVLNMLENPKDSLKADKIRRSTKEYLGIDLEHLGIIYFDHLQEIALNSRLPIVIYKPNCVLSQAVYRIADKLIQKDNENTFVADISELEDSYLTANMEAEIDYNIKADTMTEMLHSGALTEGDLIETIKAQQYEI
ncbi:MAG: MinD/ParA family protein, partial [Spirochaetes bacterium]